MDTVAIIDGILLSDAAVGHREVLSLIRGGKTVYGGGSMGALRAAELADLGMIGVGRIFEEYASGRVEGDDEVVLAFDPFTQAALSEPLINIRLNLEQAVKEGAITEGGAREVLGVLKATYYPKRSISLMRSIAKDKLGPEGSEMFERFIIERYFDYKQNDAISVLRAVKNRQAKF